MSGGDGFQDDDDVDVDGSYHDNDGEDDHNDDHDDDHDGELVKIEISGSGWRDPDEVVWPAALHIENTHMHSFHSGDDDEVDYDGGAHDDFDSNDIDDYEGNDIYDVGDADDHNNNDVDYDDKKDDKNGNNGDDDYCKNGDDEVDKDDEARVWSSEHFKSLACKSAQRTFQTFPKTMGGKRQQKCNLELQT